MAVGAHRPHAAFPACLCSRFPCHMFLPLPVELLSNKKYLKGKASVDPKRKRRLVLNTNITSEEMHPKTFTIISLKTNPTSELQHNN